MEVSFEAFEFHQDEVFRKASYRYVGSVDSGWKIFRNEELFESLGPGYELVKTLYCGICSTDIARAHLPFPLPQITGHEIIGIYHDKPVAIEINASHRARGLQSSHCPYCQNDMAIHCPERKTVGIDRLPGGFAPYLLAPKNSISPLPAEIAPELLSIIEPFAAALHAVETMQIQNEMQIAVVGPKRLGLLLLLALNFYRQQKNLIFTITAIIRHFELKEMCLLFGADNVKSVDENLSSKFDIVFDTSGSVSGFFLSADVSKNIVHLKSTNGQPVDGFNYMTQLVIDELSLFPIIKTKDASLIKSLDNESNEAILLDTKIATEMKLFIQKQYPQKSLILCDLENITSKKMNSLLADLKFGKFDIVMLTSMGQLNRVVGFPDLGSLVRPQGDIFWMDGKVKSGVWDTFLEKGLVLKTSRCGKFSNAIKLIGENVDQFNEIIPKYISGYYSLGQINKAFDLARKDKTLVKLVMKH